MKYLLALGLLGMANAQTFQHVDSGFCDDETNNLAVIASAEACQEAAEAGGYGFYDGYWTSTGTAYGCYFHPPPNAYYFNSLNVNQECSNTNEDFPCVCLVPPATECTNPSSAAAYIDAQGCDCP